MIHRFVYANYSLSNSIRRMDKMMKVVNGALNFSRKHDFVKTQVNVNLVIEEALMQAVFHLEQSGISVTKEFPRNIPIIIGSINHFELVILNIVYRVSDLLPLNTQTTVYQKIKKHMIFLYFVDYQIH